jgi:hypothetical protein
VIKNENNNLSPVGAVAQSWKLTATGGKDNIKLSALFHDSRFKSLTAI